MRKTGDASLIRVGARQLIESVHRSGGLSLLTYHQLSGQTGTRTHQAFAALLQSEYLQYEVKREFSLSHIWLSDSPDFAENSGNVLIRGLEIQGRADLILFPAADSRAVSFSSIDHAPDSPFVVEVKTVVSPLDQVPEDGEPLHWFQSLLYSYMYWMEQKALGVKIPTTIPYALAYVSAETLEAAFRFREITWQETVRWFRETCEAYITQARNIAKWQAIRNESIQQMRFPYSNLRDGQAELIRRVYESIDRTTPLLAQAPTGTGKTMSTLYPALKQLINGEFDHVFYLTAKTSTRRVAEAALQDLRTESEVKVRSLTLQAKETMCLHPELYCDTSLCPCATNYYDNLAGALTELWPVSELKPDLIMKAGAKHNVCPFELSLDLSLSCDVIIGDYNHAFDPKVHLQRYFSPDSGQQILLIDEAHNLVDRSREMYSATLESADFQILQSLFPNEKLYGARINGEVLSYFSTLQAAMEKGEPGWDQLETPPEGDTARILEQDQFRATNLPLRKLADLLVPWVQHMRELIDSLNDLRQRRKLVEMIGQAKFFLRVIDEFWSPAYIAAARITPKGLAIRLICLDVAEKLSETYMNRHATVFFSATLSPISYFSVNFCGRKADNRPDTLILPSPFPPENLEVITAAFLPTTWKKREESKAALAKAIALAILLKKGQQFVFFPSFAYMDMVMPLLQKMLAGQNIQWQIQARHMPLAARTNFLKAFDHPENGNTIIGVAVLGGIFGEGIDLVGDKLTGVSIVGVGLPQISPERNIMKEYYDEMYQGGFLFSYLYPGFNKVLQAAGRLIRSEEDRGFLLLLDERYSTPSYRELFPAEWIVEEVNDLRDLKDLLTEVQNP